MNILVIGNGFDLAHGLPTKYGDFLDFIEYKRAVEGHINSSVYIELEDMNKIYFFEYDRYKKDENFSKYCDNLPYEERYECVKCSNITGIEVYKLLFIMEYYKHEESYIKWYKSLNVERKKELVIQLYNKEITDEQVTKIIKYIDKNIKLIIDYLIDYPIDYPIDYTNFINIDSSIKDIVESVIDELRNIRNNKNLSHYIFFIYFSRWISENKDEEVKFNLFRYEKYKEVYNANKENSNFKMFDKYINGNFWIEHFFKRRNEIGEGWIDFEQEISKYIKEYDKKYKKEGEISQGKLREDLDKLIFAFEIYLKEIVEKIDIKKIYDVSKLGIDKLLSFNYTHTYNNVYPKVDISYIHGEVREDTSKVFNNMVLGIDEYLPEDKKNSDLEFIYFKKYFQRVLKQTGAEYKEWINNPMIKDNQKSLNRENLYYDYEIKRYVEYTNVYFFGHSLDVSDKDILQEIIDNKDTKIKIFYISEEQRANQIINLVKIIGQDNLIKYSFNENKKIEFIKQEYTEYYNTLINLDLFENYKNLLNSKNILSLDIIEDIEKIIEIIFPEKIKDNEDDIKKILEEIEDENLTGDDLEKKVLEEIEKYNKNRASALELLSKIKKNLENSSYTEVTEYLSELIKQIDNQLEEKFN